MWNPRDVSVRISQKLSHEEDVRVWNSQFRGIIKYLSPSSDWVTQSAAFSAYKLISLRAVTANEIYAWVLETNPAWLPFVKHGILKLRIREVISIFGVRVKKILKPFLRRLL